MSTIAAITPLICSINGYYVSPTAVDGTAAAAKILADGTIHDSKGPLRDIPMNDQSSNASYTLIISDAGKLVHASGTTSTCCPKWMFLVQEMLLQF